MAHKRRLESAEMIQPAKKQKINQNEDTRNQEYNAKIQIEKFMKETKQQFLSSIEEIGIIDLILLFSNHIQIFNSWLSIYDKLGKYSFLMKKGCSLSELLNFEKEINFDLFDDVRISLLLCNGVSFPAIFSQNSTVINDIHPNTPQPLNFAPEICLQSIKETISSGFIMDDDDFAEIDLFGTKYFDKNIWRKNENDWDDIQRFLNWKDVEFHDDQNHEKNFEALKYLKVIGGVSETTDCGGIVLYWSVKSNKILSIEYKYDDYTMYHSVIYESFGDYISKWSKLDYYSTFNTNWLREDLDNPNNMGLDDLYKCILHDFLQKGENDFLQKTRKFVEILHDQCY